jgi:F-type H+-transporting ATPase subunit O
MLVRSFSTSNVANQLIKPPLQLFGIDGRYATALYSAATKQKTLEVVEKDLIKFQNAVQSDSKLREFIKNPTVKRAVKVDILKSITGQISLNPEASNLLQLLAENGRLKNVDKVIDAFKLIMAAHRGEITCEVVTARELDAAQKQKLEAVLKTFVKSKETIFLTARVDPGIIGGMVVSIGDRYVDMSVASKIKKYKEILTAPV